MCVSKQPKMLRIYTKFLKKYINVDFMTSLEVMLGKNEMIKTKI